jgi:hypothetical protein
MKCKNPVIPSVIHHHQNPLESTWVWCIRPLIIIVDSLTEHNDERIHLVSSISAGHHGGLSPGYFHNELFYLIFKVKSVISVIIIPCCSPGKCAFWSAHGLDPPVGVPLRVLVYYYIFGLVSRSYQYLILCSVEWYDDSSHTYRSAKLFRILCHFCSQSC